MLSASVCTLMLVGALEIKAADDSYVDLSVLNNLQSGDSLFVETQPLFPIVKKETATAPKIKKAKKKTVKKTSTKAPKQEKVKTQNQEAKKTEEKIEILPQTPEIEQPLAEEKAVESQTEIKPAEIKTLAPQVKEEAKVEEEKIATSQDHEAAPMTSQTLEQMTPAQAPEKSDDVITPSAKQTLSSSQEEAIPIETVDKGEKAEDQLQQVATPSQEAKLAQQPLSSEISPSENTTTETAEKIIEPLIPQSTEQDSLDEKEEIRFTEGSYEISEENAQKILNLIATFENPQQNKIAIYAYNYDNGENSFKKKKLSLDRATEIRSLLLNKGYKNFSIKVINVTDNPDKGNLVEIEEIK